MTGNHGIIIVIGKFNFTTEQYNTIIIYDLASAITHGCPTIYQMADVICPQ